MRHDEVVERVRRLQVERDVDRLEVGAEQLVEGGIVLRLLVAAEPPEPVGPFCRKDRLARTVDSARLYTGGRDATMRMYPGGLRDLVDGWTRTIATGARHAPWWAVAATIAWIWSLAGGWLAVPWVYPLSALQVWVLGRRAGSFSPWIAIVYPAAVVVFVVVVARSAWRVVRRRDVVWKDRPVPAR